MKLGNFLVRFLGPLAIILPTSIAAQTPADCDFAFSERGITIPLLASDLGSGQSVAGSEEIEITATNARPSACVTTLRLSRITATQAFPNYVVTASNQPITPSANETIGGQGNEIRIALPASSLRNQVSLKAVASTDWGLVAGSSTEQLQLSLVGPGGDILDRIPLNLELEIPKTVDVMFVGDLGGGQTSNIDLGELSSEETVTSSPFGVRIWSSSGYRFGFTSQNAGKLVHRQGMDRIPYDLMVDGIPYSLESGAAELRREQASAPSGDNYGLTIRVPARRSVAGEYQDRLTVSVTAI